MKDRLGIDEIELKDIKQKIKEYLSNNENTIKDSVIIKKCGHAFHTKCIKEWFKERNTCPMCRSELNDNHDGRDIN